MEATREEAFFFRDREVFHISPELRWDYFHVAVPIAAASLLWAISVPMQTAILGRLSADAIAANSVATTFYQYMKVIVVAMASTSAVMMGKTVGKGDIGEMADSCGGCLYPVGPDLQGTADFPAVPEL